MRKIFWRKFGCEFELSSSFEDVSNSVKKIIPKIYGDNKLYSKQRFYRSVNNNKWNLKTDATTYCELATPVSFFEDLPKIKKVLALMKKDKLEITENDSVHIHMQANDLDKNHIIAAWMQIERAIMRCYPKHRRSGNTYTQEIMEYRGTKKRIAEFFLEAAEASSEHHRDISLTYFDNKKTVEFRLGEGTLDGHIVSMFIKFYAYFLKYAKMINPVEVICQEGTIAENAFDMLKLLEIRDSNIRNFITMREEKYKN